MVRALISLAAFLCAFATTYGQTLPFHYDSGHTWRAYIGTVTPPLCPDRECHFYPTSETSGWSPQYTEFNMWRSQTDNSNSVVDFLNFRVLFPQGYKKSDHSKKYPVILFLHGAGEGGRKWTGSFDYQTTDPLIDNNSRVLIHGGNEHKMAVKDKAYTDPNSFPGIVVFPQVSYNGSWSDGWDNGNVSTNEEYTIAFIEHIIAEYNGDINHVAVHGLSNGGKATWDFATKRPDMFCAMQPFSGVPYDNANAAALLYTMPIIEYQGGLDTNPAPGAAQDAIAAINAAGGNAQLVIYPDLGHGTWQTAMAQPTFFSWIRAQDKRKIYVVGGSNALCNTAGATKILAFSAGFKKYQWYKIVGGVPTAIDTIAVPSAKTRALSVGATDANTGFGTYMLKFMRKDNVWYDSFTQAVVTQGAPFTPPVTVSGSTFLPYTRDNGITPGSTGQTRITLTAPTGYKTYKWYKNGVAITNGTIVSASTSGQVLTINPNNINATNYTTYASYQATTTNYTVVTTDVSGCISDNSAGIKLYYDPTTATTAGSLGTATAPPYHTSPAGPNGYNNNNVDFTAIGTPVLTPLSENSMKVTWTDAVADEDYFEIWRYRRSGGTPVDYGSSQANYLLITTVPANTTTFIDNLGLRPLGEYTYRIRAIKGTVGRFSAEPNKVKTSDDTQAPSPPTDLKVTASTKNSITTTWTASRDNDVVYQYEVFSNGVLVATLFSDNVGDLTDGNPAPPTTYTFTGLESAASYVLNVRAVDLRGNRSSFPESVVGTTYGLTNCLSFKYYKVTGITGTAGNQLVEPAAGGNLNFATAIPTQQGTLTTGFDVVTGATAYQGTTDPNLYYYAFDGFVNILNAGKYRFRTNSDDGSRLYIDGALVVNNDGDHGGQDKDAIVTLTVGFHAIRVTFYENGGGQSLTVTWSFSAAGTPSTTTTAIPLTQLYYYGPGTPFVNNYYLKPGSTDLTVLANWGKSTNGTGAAPTNFTGDNQAFNITTAATVGNATAWAVSGQGSRVVVGNGGALTLNGTVTGRVYATGNGVLNLYNATLPQLTKLDSLTTVNMYVGGTLPIAVYGNLNLANPGSAVTATLPLSSTIVKGALSVADQVAFNGASANQSVLSVKGNVTFAGTSGATSTDDNSYMLSLKGNAPHTITVGNNDLKLYGLSLDLSSTLNFDFGGATSGRTITIGAKTSGQGSQGLLLGTGSQMNLLGHSLVVNGVYGLNPTDDSGVINTTGGNITLNIASASSSNLFFTAGSTLNNLSFTNAKAGVLNINTPVILNNLATFNSSTTVFTDFTVKSDATSTARIGAIGSNAKVNGNITVQRYMNDKGVGVYRYLSSPIKNLKVADLQQYFLVTGNFTGTSVIPGVTSSASMFSYTDPNYIQFPVVGGTNQDSLRRGVGYSTFIRETGGPVVWQGKGPIYQGSIALPMVPDNTPSNLTDAWNLVGNPYPAPIKWATTSTTPGAAWVGTGVYQTISVRENWNGGFAYRTYNPVTGGSADPHGGPTPYDGVIAVGQAFWIQSNSVTPSLTINESAKVNNDGAFFREGDPVNTMSVILKNGTYQDETFIHFDAAATDAFDKGLDGVKLANSFFNLSTLSSDNISLVVNLTSGNVCSQDVKMRIAGAAVGAYSLIVTGQETIAAADQVVLIDGFTNTQTVLSGDLTYPFNITSDAASKADGRFKLRFIKPGIDFEKTLAAKPGCDDANPIVTVNDSQPGVSYTAFMDGVAISAVGVGNGGSLDLLVDPTKVTVGKSNVTVQAGFGQCAAASLTQTINVTKNDLALISPITMSAGIFSAPQINAATATYQWYLEGEAITTATNSQLTPDADGNFTVQVTSGGCIKTSDAFYRQPLTTSMQVTSSEVCNDNAIVSLDSSQEGVMYTAYYNDSAVSSAVAGTGNSMSITLNSDLIDKGEKQITIKANNVNDTPKTLDKTVTVIRDVLETPVVKVTGITSLSSTEAGTSYKWFLNGAELTGETDRTITATSEGTYAVTVTSGTCVATSANLPLIFTVTLDLDMNSVAACDDTDPTVTISQSQAGVEYKALYNDQVISSTVVGDGNDITLTVDRNAIGFGDKSIKIQAGFDGATQYDLTNSVTVHRDYLPEPTVVISSSMLTASVDDATGYRWFLDGTLIPDETSKTLDASVSGSYSVEVTNGSCLKTSVPVEYSVPVENIVLGLGDDPAFVQAFPNPARDRVTVTTGQSLATHAIQFQTVLGQSVRVPMTKVDDKSVELDITQLTAGLYLLHVNGKTIRIAKE